MNKNSDYESRLVISYLALRRAVGILGLTFPFILVLGGFLNDTPIQTSVSDYYHTSMRDIFVGILFAVATFLLAYKGYERKDAIAGNIAGVCAIGVALVPTTPDINPTDRQELMGMFHLIFAAGYFCTLAYFCLFLFTKTGKGKPTPRKLQRNRVYKVSGFIILLSITLIALLFALPANLTEPVMVYKPVFWLEAIAIVAYGLAWLVKGEVILADFED